MPVSKNEREEYSRGVAAASAADGYTVLTTVQSVSTLLELRLQVAMKHKSKRLIKKIFEGTGPLATVEARADLAFAYGYIDQKMRKTISILQRVRNRFAHALSPITFEEPKIREILSELEEFKPENFGVPIEGSPGTPIGGVIGQAVQPVIGRLIKDIVRNGGDEAINQKFFPDEH